MYQAVQTFTCFYVNLNLPPRLKVFFDLFWCNIFVIVGYDNTFPGEYHRSVRDKWSFQDITLEFGWKQQARLGLIWGQESWTLASKIWKCENTKCFRPFKLLRAFMFNTIYPRDWRLFFDLFWCNIFVIVGYDNTFPGEYDRSVRDKWCFQDITLEFGWKQQA